MTTYSPSSLSNERLELLYRVSQTFNSSLDLDQVLNTVIDQVIAVIHAERGFVVLREPDGALVFRVARGMHQTTIDDPQFQVSRGVVDQVIREGKPVLTSNAQADSRFSGRQSVSILGLSAILCAPLKVRETILGAVYVENRLQAGLFTEEDLAFLEAIAASAAISIENARLYQVAVEKGRMERELQLAYRVQSSLIPAEAPQLEGWEFCAHWLPARQVSGDFYDFFPTRTGALGIVVADVSDKGIPAALFMANSRSLLRASLMVAEQPLQGFTNANRLVCADAADGMFLTMFYGQLEPATGQMRFINAGHNPPLLYRHGKTSPAELSRTGMALGVDEMAGFQEGQVMLQPGDLLVLFTDGLPDAMDDQGSEFSMERVRAAIQARLGEPAPQVLASLLEALSAHTGAAPPFDDVTIVIIKRC